MLRSRCILFGSPGVLFMIKAKTEITEVGDQVNCDVCNADYTDRTDSGGFLFGSYAYCPECAKSRLEKIRGYGEEKYITEHCPPDMSFADWCRRLRYKMGLTQIKETTFEEVPDESHQD